MPIPATVSAKLARPRPQRVIDRPRLLTALQAQVPEHVLTTVIAGPGYGKTTLLATFAEDYVPGVVWYSTGDDDADLAVFVAHLITGLKRQSLRIGNTVRLLLEEGASESRSAATVAGAFLNDVHRIRQPLAIVLDDFHTISGSEPVVEFLETVIDNLKGKLRFVIAARNDPFPGTARYRVRRQLFELGPDELAFTKEETRQLLEDVTGKPPAESLLAHLDKATDGWVGALQLLLAAGIRGPESDIPAGAGPAQPGSDLHRYLTEEVLRRLPDALREWMLYTSSLEELDMDLLGTLFPPATCDANLHELLSRKLVTAYHGTTRPVFRFYTLLQDFLRARFQVEIPGAKRDAFHRRAAEAYASRGDTIRAGRLLACSSDPAELAAFLKLHALSLLDQGHYQALLTWFEELPHQALDADPWLRLRLADVRHYLGDLPGAELEYERARGQFDQSVDAEGEAWAVIGLGRIWNMRGQADRTVDQGMEVLSELDQQPDTESRDEILVRLLQVLSGAQFYLGRYEAALELLDRLETHSQGRPERQAAVWNNRAVVWASQGNYTAAARAFERGLERPGVRGLPRASTHLANLALLLEELGDYERAQALFHEAMDLAHRYRNRSHLVACLLGQARLAYRLGDLERSLGLLRQAEETNADLKIALFEADGWALRSRILRDRGQIAAARTAISSALAAYGASSRDANWLLYRVDAAVIELRAERLEEAQRSLEELLDLSLELESLFPRTMIYFFLGEVERRRNGVKASAHFRVALELAGSMGYDSALRAELRRSPETVRYLFEHAIQLETLSRLVSGLGPDAEPLLLEVLKTPGLAAPTRAAVFEALNEVGGSETLEFLNGSPETGDPLAGAARAAILRRLPGLAPEPQGARLRIEALGSLRIVGPEGEIPRTAWKSGRALSIFVYLAHAGKRGASKERLMDLFWSGEPSRRAERNFHPTLSYIRAALKDAAEHPAIQAENGVYRLHPELEIGLDTAEFESLTREAQSMAASPERTQKMRRALALYRGDFLAERYEFWAEELRAQFASRYEALLAQTAEDLRKGGDPDGALELYLRVLERDPYREEVHTQVMVCYHSLGNRRALRDQFQHLEGLLRAELNVEPLPETRELYESLMLSL